MKPEYTYSESLVKPTELEIGKRSVVIRRNIVEEERMDINNEPVTYWVYEEARMSFEDFAEYSNYIIIADQKNSKDNQLVLMEAIVDLYEMVLNLGQEGSVNG